MDSSASNYAIKRLGVRVHVSNPTLSSAVVPPILRVCVAVGVFSNIVSPLRDFVPTPHNSLLSSLSVSCSASVSNGAYLNITRQWLVSFHSRARVVRSDIRLSERREVKTYRKCSGGGAHGGCFHNLELCEIKFAQSALRLPAGTSYDFS